MVIVGGVFEVEPGRREAFLVAHHEMIRISRAEPGCLEYAYCADPIEPGRVVLFERWVDQESLDAHLRALRARPQETSDEVEPVSTSITIYDVAGERSL